jgi:hypothetical protein
MFKFNLKVHNIIKLKRLTKKIIIFKRIHKYLLDLLTYFIIKNGYYIDQIYSYQFISNSIYSLSDRIL